MKKILIPIAIALASIHFSCQNTDAKYLLYKLEKKIPKETNKVHEEILVEIYETPTNQVVVLDKRLNKPQIKKDTGSEEKVNTPPAISEEEVGHITVIEIPGIEMVKREIQYSTESRTAFLAGSNGEDLMFINWFRDSETFKAVIVEKSPSVDTTYLYIGLKRNEGWLTIFSSDGTDDIEKWMLGHEGDKGANWGSSKPVQEFLNRDMASLHHESIINLSPAWRNAILALEIEETPLTEKNIETAIYRKKEEGLSAAPVSY
jgi:hypothetical protein